MMDIKKTKKSQKNKAEHTSIKHNPIKMWGAVAICMVIIVIIWGVWFYPNSLKTVQNEEAQNKYINFKNTITNSFSIFDKNKTKTLNESEENLDVEYLRQRVYGDSANRNQ